MSGGGSGLARRKNHLQTYGSDEGRTTAPAAGYPIQKPLRWEMPNTFRQVPQK
jgi:hypothetical protein